MLKSFVNLVLDSEYTFYHILKRKLNYSPSRWCYFSYPGGLLCSRADWTLAEPGYAPPLWSTSSLGKQGRAAPRGEEIRPLAVVQTAVTHTDAGPQEAALFVCPVYTFMLLFLFYFWDLMPVELLLTKKLKELAQFQVGFLGAGSKNPEELTIHLVFLCWLLNGIPVVPRMAWCSRYLVSSQRTSHFAF